MEQVVLISRHQPLTIKKIQGSDKVTTGDIFGTAYHLIVLAENQAGYT